MGGLDGPGFSAADLAGPRRGLLRTNLRLAPGGLVAVVSGCLAIRLAHFFGIRQASATAQLAGSTDPRHGLRRAWKIECGGGMEPSRAGAVGAAWLRTLRTTGQAIYSGWYSSELIPAADRPSIRVVFPLPNGSVTVLLRPEVRLRTVRSMPSSPAGKIRAPRAPTSVVARPDRRKSGWALRVPLAERFVVFVDNEGVLRTDHELNLEPRASPAAPLSTRVCGLGIRPLECAG